MAKKRPDNTRRAVASSGWRGELVRYVPFAVAFCVLELSLMYAAQAGLFSVWQQQTAVTANSILRALGYATVLSGASVVTSRGMVTVEGLCLPISPLALGVALVVFQTRLSWPRRAAWAASLVPLMALVAVLRIALVAAMMEAGSPLMPLVHESLSPVLWMAVPVVWWMLALQGERGV